MYQTSRIFTFFCLLLLAACNQKKQVVQQEDGIASFNADSLKKDIAMLASDSFKGRKPFTEGETKTIDYMQKQFASIGLEPGNGISYVQAVPMVNI